MSETVREKLIEVRAKCLYEAMYPSFKFENALELDKTWYKDAATHDADWFLQALSSLPDEELKRDIHDLLSPRIYSLRGCTPYVGLVEIEIDEITNLILAQLAPKLAVLEAQKNEAVRAERDYLIQIMEDFCILSIHDFKEKYKEFTYDESGTTTENVIKSLKAKYLKAESER
jgi:hypothetical protein